MKFLNSYFFKILTVVTLISSCNTKNDTFNTVINGNISGLRKGVLYLKKVEDTLFVVKDSIKFYGNENFKLQLNIPHPDVYHLHLDKNDGVEFNDMVEVFLEPNSEISITSTVDKFAEKIKISGSKNHNSFQTFNNIRNKFNLKQLKLTERLYLQASKKNRDSVKIIKNQLSKLVKNKYLYATNFALQNNNLDVAPFIAIRELNDAKIHYLDTIYNSLSAEIKKSYHGDRLRNLINSRKIDEATN